MQRLPNLRSPRHYQSRGVTILEAIIAGVLIAAGVIASMISFKQIAKTREAIEATNAIDRFESYLKTTLQFRLARFYKSSAGTCNRDAMVAALTFDSPAGIRLAPIDPASLTVNPLDGPRARTALERCRTQQTIFPAGADVQNAPRQYFCLRVTPIPGDPDAGESFAGLELVFGEFTFTINDPVSGAPKTCAQFAAPQPGVTSSINYGFYWNGANHLPRASFGNSLLGTL